MSARIFAQLGGVARTGFAQIRSLQAQAAVYTETGDPQSVIRVVERCLPDKLSDDQVLVRMLAAPVNPSDLNQIEGTYPVRGTFDDIVTGSETMKAAVGGNEGVGEVVNVGNSVSGLVAGDWVVPRQSGRFGTWCTHTVTSAHSLSLVPASWRAGLDPLDVACLKVNPCTAYRLLRDFGQLDRGDYVIQNGANSGVGRAVIQLARQWGIRTINVVRDRPELDELQQELQALGADIVVTDKQLGSDDTKRLLKSLGAPIRLGFNCVGGRTTLQMTKFISSGGCLVSYGGMSRQPVTMPTSLLLFKDLSARGFWMNRWYVDATNSEILEKQKLKMWSDILELTRSGLFVRQPLAVSRWPDGLDAAEAQPAVRNAVAWGAGLKHAFVFGN
ncbi:mitochondrial 2-enoyl thioester reductase [Coemansia sp. RSA 2611]|nr:mitochondrial 2-enoyl thioester reductase [Coemansia sp. RSA 2611]